MDGPKAKALLTITEARKMLSMFSLSLMFSAGLMAISFWIIEQFYDPFWWGLNLWLLVLPLAIVYLRLSGEGTPE